MTKAQDIIELIGGYSTERSERKELEAVAEALEESLSTPVPSRPEFQAELRARLMAQSRRQLAPWYRRPAVWAGSAAVAAAIGALAFGLRTWQQSAGDPQTESHQPAPPQTPGIARYEQKVVPRLTSDLNVPVVWLPDEPMARVAVDKNASPVPGTSPGLVAPPEPDTAPGSVSPPGTSTDPASQVEATPDLSQGLKVFVLTGRPDAGQFGQMAQGLGLQPAAQPSEPFVASDGSRHLALASDGHVTYYETVPDSTTKQPLVVDAITARDAARRFLDRVVLPVPDLNPTVMEHQVRNQRHFIVTYTPQVEGRPVVNARTVVEVTPSSAVVRAEAFVQTGQMTLGAYEPIQADEAIARAQAQGGGTFERAELVYVRTTSDSAVYLQPYWRVYGSDSKGVRMARYVPALVRETK